MWDALLVFVVFVPLLFLVYTTTVFIGGKTQKTMQGKNIKVIETINIGVDKRVHLIKAGKEFFLIASSGKVIELLSKVDLPDYQESTTVPSIIPLDFKSILDRYSSVLKVRGNKRSSEDEHTNEK